MMPAPPDEDLRKRFPEYDPALYEIVVLSGLDGTIHGYSIKPRE